MIDSCRVCGSDDLKLYYTQGNEKEFRFYRCGKCTLVNLDLEHGTDQGKYVYSTPDPFDNTSRTNRAQTQSFEFLARYAPRKGRLFDIGCGNGRILHLARQEGWDPTGLELNEEFAEAVSTLVGVPVKIGNFLEYEVAEQEKYDVAILRHVLEHLPDSILALTKIRSFLSDDGFALLEFPNIEALDIKLKRWQEDLGLRKKTYREGYKPGHCNEFCRTSFEFLAKRCGFRILKWQSYSHSPVQNALFNVFPIGNKVRVLLQATSDPDVLN